MMMRLIDAPLGSILSVYMNDDNSISWNGLRDKTMQATVVCMFHSNHTLTSILIGWTEKEPKPARGIEYRGNLGDTHKTWHDWPDNGYVYTRHPNIDQFTHGLWVRGADGNQIVDSITMPDGKPIEGQLLPDDTSQYKHINPADIKPGDTVVWIAKGNTINHATVINVEEGETYTEEPCVVIDGIIYCNGGRRHFPKGYELLHGMDILLIKREAQ